MFQFCPRCGKKLPTRLTRDDRLINCDSCGFHFYLAPALTNALIIENNNQVLLVKRKGEPKKGWWDLPGGFVEFDETLKQSTRREIREELGLEIKEMKYLTSVIDRYFYKEINYHTICAVFSAKLPPNQEIKVHDDIDGYEFFPKDQIPFNKLAFKGLEIALKKFIEA